MDWLRLTLVLLLVFNTASSFSNVECPDGPDCGRCYMFPHREFEIQCGIITGTSSSFIIKFVPEEYVSITCNGSHDWKNFHLGITRPLQRVKQIHFSMCQLPQGKQLGAIVRQLVVNAVEGLDFKSYGNLSSTLSRDVLQDFKNITKLTLSSNSLTNVSDDLLNDFSNLKTLNLRDNNLRELPANFLNTPSLESIELGTNDLEVIEPSAFANLGQLKLLNLWDNKLVEIKPHSFDNLTLLTYISLLKNKLTTLPADILSRLPNLKMINLSRNNFSGDSLPADLLRNNSKLMNVIFYENKRNLTTLPNKFFGNLTNLSIVRINKNGLIRLPEDLFWGTTGLTNLSIERNYLISLPPNIFRDCTNLSTLDLSFNELKHLPDRIFSPLSKLERLDLSMNHIQTISENLLNGLFSLKVLNMERNRMKFIDMQAFRNLQNLRIAKFSYNELTLIPITRTTHGEDLLGPQSPFHYCAQHIEELHLAHNNISEIFGDWMMAIPLRVLNLAHNQLKSLYTTDLQFFSNHINVDLTYNEISRILLRDAESLATLQTERRNAFINIENNPVLCDCNLYDLLRYREGRMQPNVQNLFHLKMDNLKCHGPNWLQNITVINLKSKTLRCEVFESATYNISCPKNCNCWMRPDDRAYLIDCSNKGLTEAPRAIRCPNTYHVEMNLSGNLLSTVPSLSQPGYDKVTVLSLSRNNISEVSLDALSTDLEQLDLHNNNLRKLNSEVLKFWENSTKLKNLTLYGNAWACNCEARDFLNFIQAKQTKIPELQKVTCSIIGTPIYEMTPDELCPLTNVLIIGICIGVALLGIIIGSIAATYYRYQHEVKVWLYARQWCLWFVTESELDKNKIYDAFISYSHKDEEFIVNTLVPKLEEGPRSFKLCIHYRDWLAGEWIPAQISKSVEDSRRTIVVLSPNFLESEWGRMEFRAAHNRALKEGRARVIVIIYGDIGSTENLDPELKTYLTTNTYVQWGDPWFWKKLRYALPHPTDFKKKIKEKKQTVFETHNPTINVGNDKSELIQSNRNATTPPLTSTPPADTIKTFISIENETDKNSINGTVTKESQNANGILTQTRF